MTEPCVLLGVEYNQTLRYSKEQNAMVERANNEVLRHCVTCFMISESSQHGPIVYLLYRGYDNEPNEHLGVFSAQLVLGI